MLLKKLIINFRMLLIILLLGNLILGCSEDKSFFDRGILFEGNTADIKNIMLKAEKGERIVIGLIGGSITQGARASQIEKSYGYQVAKWWKENFSTAEISISNAGIGSTGSDVGVFRLNNHLLRYKPDLVFIEFSVNDANTKMSAEKIEGIIRQILDVSDHPPAIVLLMMCNAEFVSAQEWHSKIGYYYNLPMISFKNAIYPEFQSGRLKADQIFEDGLHPNDSGHELIAELVCSFFSHVKSELKTSQKQIRQKLSPPLISKKFDHTDFFQPVNLNPFLNTGWRIGPVRRFGSAWESGISGSEIGFEVEASEINLLYDRDQNAGVVEVFVDDLPPKRISAAISSYPSPGVINIIREEKPEKHKIIIKSIDGSSGRSFKLIAFMTAL
jgi:lysophospholipase L1-like esterase